MPIYGLRDAGRQFWKSFRSAIVKCRLKENRGFKAFYTYSEDGDIKVMLGTHVDDLMYACKPGYEQMLTSLFDTFEVKQFEEGNFRFCGREIAQDDSGNITVTCKDTAVKTLPINWKSNGRNLEAKATEGEISQLRSVVGSLAWIARQCRPGLSYSCSKLQSVAPAAQLKHLKEANRVLQDAIAGARQGCYYKARAFDWNECVLGTITDASWAGETSVIEDKVFPRKSQMGRVTVLADPRLWDGKSCDFHVIGWKSTLIHRQCRSTMHAETQSLCGGVGMGAKIRTAIAEARGLRDDDNRDESCARAMKHVWLTDCESLHSYLNNPVAAPVEDKRLEIDLLDLRQILWEDWLGNPKDEVTEDECDRCIWIDTSTMIADPLTKAMKSDRLDDAISSCWLDLEPMAESQMAKLMKQQSRSKSKDGKVPKTVSFDDSHHFKGHRGQSYTAEELAETNGVCDHADTYGDAVDSATW